MKKEQDGLELNLKNRIIETYFSSNDVKSTGLYLYDFNILKVDLLYTTK